MGVGVNIGLYADGEPPALVGGRRKVLVGIVKFGRPPDSGEKLCMGLAPGA